MIGIFKQGPLEHRRANCSFVFLGPHQQNIYTGATGTCRCGVKGSQRIVGGEEADVSTYNFREALKIVFLGIFPKLL